MSDKNNSTLQGIVDQASGAIQSAMGSITGNTSQEAKGEAHHDKGAAEADASHTVGKVGPFAATPEGGVSKDNPDRGAGSWNQNVGSAKEAIGGFVGAEGLKREGQQQNAAGKQQQAQGQLSDLGGGIGDRVTGAFGGAVAGVTGDREAQRKYQDMHDDGKAKQRSAEAEIDKQGPP